MTVDSGTLWVFALTALGVTSGGLVHVLAAVIQRWVSGVVLIALGVTAALTGQRSSQA